MYLKAFYEYCFPLLYRSLVCGSLGGWIPLLLFGEMVCSNQQASHTVLSEDRFVRLFGEMAVVTYGYESGHERAKAYEQVMGRYGLSQRDMEATLSHFEETPGRWIAIMEGISEELKRLSQEGAL